MNIDTDILFDRNSEYAVLACVVLDRQAWLECKDLLSPQAFGDPACSSVWSTINKLYTDGRHVDFVTLNAELQSRGLLTEIGGTVALAEILQSEFHAAGARGYAEIVSDRHTRREMLRLASRAASDARGPEPALEVAQRLADSVAQLLQRGNPVRAVSVNDLLHDAYDRLSSGETQGLIGTGYPEIDDEIGGIGPGEMCLIGARPSVGKSTLARSICLNAMLSGVPTVLVTLEESNAKVARNLMSNRARFDNHRFRKPAGITAAEWAKIANAIGPSKNWKGWVVEKTPRLSQMHAELSRLKAKYGIQLVLIDYLQRVQAGGANAYERASLASTGISNMLKDLDLAGIIPTQLSRGIEHRDDKMPSMADLRDSGQIEQDADVILMLHREDYHRQHDPNYTPTGEADVYVAKARDGIRGKVLKLRAMLRYQAFESTAIL